MDKQLLNYFNGDDFPASVWKGKYAKKGEITPDDMHHRLAKEFARIDSRYQESENDNIKWNKLSIYGRHRDNLNEQSIYNLFKDFKYIIPQGRVMFK